MNGLTLAAQVAGVAWTEVGARLALRRHLVASRREVRAQDNLALEAGGFERQSLVKQHPRVALRLNVNSSRPIRLRLCGSLLMTVSWWVFFIVWMLSARSPKSNNPRVCISAMWIYSSVSRQRLDRHQLLFGNSEQLLPNDTCCSSGPRAV
jgi:hypothetical protein